MKQGDYLVNYLKLQQIKNLDKLLILLYILPSK
jgi:hypothetical protein